MPNSTDASPKDGSARPLPLGELLVHHGLLTPVQLQEALTLQKRWGTRLGDIILANFSNDYVLISKPMTAASSIHVRFINNETTFRWVYPIIGKPTTSSAITPYKGSGTFGPFITLATRA